MECKGPPECRGLSTPSRLIENIVECKDLYHIFHYHNNLRLIENIVECKGAWTGTVAGVRKGLIENIVECKDGHSIDVIRRREVINRKHSGM